MTKKRNRRPQPLAPPPQSSALRSRKRARQVTTLFHKYTQERDAAISRAVACGVDDGDANDDTKSRLTPHQIELLNEVKKWDGKLAEIGGREEYQRASQMNTSLFSTSKWVLGILGKWGWLDGLPVSPSDNEQDYEQSIKPKGEPPGDILNSNQKIIQSKRSKKKKVARRDVRLLEVGAINTQLLDAASRTRIKSNTDSKVSGDDELNKRIKNNAQSTQTERVYHLDVTAIDIRSTDPRIQQMDFFDLPLPTEASSYYDVIVNSMVINCVTTPAQRGQMLVRLYKQLRPGGLCFLTLPKLCLIQSKFMSRAYFEEILTKGVGFEIVQEVNRESPKIAFFVLRRPMKEDEEGVKIWNEKFARTSNVNRGKKYRNSFAVTLDLDDSNR